MLTRAEILMMNDIISKVYTETDFREMRREVLRMLKPLIPYNQATFYMASKAKDHLLADPVGIEIEDSELQRYINDYEDKDYTRWIFMSGKSMVYRESELFPDSMRENQEYYKEIYQTSHIYYSMQASVAYDGNFQGIVSFYRSKDQEDFSDKEIFIMETLLVHLENRINQELLHQGGGVSIMSKAYFDAYRFIEDYSLTKREVEVLGLLIAGVQNDMICDTLSVTVNTLKKHCINIYKKLGISNRWELINFK